MLQKAKNYLNSLNSFDASTNTFLVLIALWFAMPRVWAVEPETGLDPSWSMAINLAFSQGLTFGKDFIFTFGPLGFFFTRYHVYVSDLWFWAFDLSLAVAIALTVLNILKRLNSVLSVIAFLACLLHINLTNDSVFLLLILFIINLLEFSRSGNKAQMAIVVLIPAIVFFIKLNLGLVMYVLYFISIFLSGKSLKIAQKAGSIIATTALIAVLAWLLNVYIPAYVGASKFIIDGYNDAMNITGFPAGDFKYMMAACYLSLILITGILSLNLLRNRDFQALQLFFLIGGAAYVCIKQGFVRADILHTPLAIAMLLSIGGITLLYTESLPKLKPYAFTAFALLSFTSVMFVRQTYAFTSPYHDLLGLRPLVKASKEQTALPEKWVKAIGKSGVDAFPIDIFWIGFNNLKYQPRPVIQSYKPYHPELQSKNINFYNSENAPDFILLSRKTIDSRNPFWDEPGTQLVMAAKYEPIDSMYQPKMTNCKDCSSDSIILLQKKKVVTKYTERSLLKTNYTINTVLKIPITDNPIRLYAKVNYTTKSKVRRFLFQPPWLSAEITLADGSIQRYKAIVPALMNGFIINKQPENHPQLWQFMQNPKNIVSNVVSIKLEGIASDFAPNIELELTEVIGF